MLVDSHCHLDAPSLAPEIDAVLARAEAAGVGTLLTIGTRLSTFGAVRAIAEAHERVWCSVGIHPHDVAEEGGVMPARLVALANHPKVIGIGETGLDYYYQHSPRADQIASFRTHMAAAREAGLPVIVHTRSADEDTVALLREGAAAGALNGVIHCFSTAREVAEEALELGFYISLSGIVTFNKADDLRATARDLPLDRLLVETDAPYLAPVPRRGKRNEPAYVVHTARLLAELYGLELDALARLTTDNFFRLFDRARRPAADHAGSRCV